VVAEQTARDGRDLRGTVLTRAAAGHRGAGPDAAQRRRLAALAHAAHRHGHVGALPAAVGVQLIEDEEPQPSCHLAKKPF
jgi:hypothetical protein